MAYKQPVPEEFTTEIDDTEVIVSFYYDASDPGCYSGPYENCYPSEPESIEIVSVLLDGVDVYEALTCQEQEELDEKCLEYINEENQSRAEAAADFYYECERDRRAAALEWGGCDGY